MKKLIGLFLVVSGFYINIFSQNLQVEVQTGHTSGITSVDFAPDGKRFISGSGDNSIIQWDIETGKQVRKFTGHQSSVEAVKYSPDSKTFVSASADFLVKLWDVKSGKELKTFKDHFLDLRAVNFSHDGKYIVSGGFDKTIKIWDVETGKRVKTFWGHKDMVFSVCFNAKGDKILSGSGDNTAKLWDVKSGEVIKTFFKHSKSVTSVAFSPDDKIMAVASADKTISLWNVKKGTCINSLDEHTDGIKSLQFYNDGNNIVSGGYDAKLIFWDVNKGSKIKEIKTNSDICSISINEETQTLLCGHCSGNNKEISFWDLKTYKQIKTFQGYTLPVMSFSIHPNEKEIITGGSDKNLKLWDLEKGSLKKSFNGHVGTIYSVDYNPNGQNFISGGKDQKVLLWDKEIPVPIKKFTEIKGTLHAVSFSEDGNKLVAGGTEEVKVFDATTGEVIQKFDGHQYVTFDLIFCKNDTKILGGGSGEDVLKLWDINSGNLEKTFKPLNVNPPLQYFSPDYYDKNLDATVYSIVVSPDGNSFISGITDRSVKIWNFENNNEIKTLNGHGDIVNDVDYNSSGDKIVSGSGDNTLKLWDANTGSEIRTYKGHSSGVLDVEFTKNDERIVSSSYDGTLFIWDTESGKEIARLISIIPNESIILLPDYYYSASIGAHKGLAFTLDDKVYTFEQFDLRLNRPDIVIERLGYASPLLVNSYKQAYVKRLKKMNFTEEMLGNDFHLPEIQVMTDKIPVTTESKSLSLKIKATDSKYLLDRINVYINDVPVYGVQGIDLRGKNTNTHEEDITLQLLNGENKIQVSVLNNKGAESLKKTFYIKYKGPKAKPDLYVISIGVSEFVDNQYNLTYAAKDANDVSNTFKQNSIFGNINVIEFTNSIATKDNILRAKETLMNSKVDDMVILFIASHGLLSNDMDYFIASHDVDFYDPHNKGIPYDEMENLLDGIPALKKVMLIDACHSGEVDKDEMVLADVEMQGGEVKSRGFKSVKKKENQLGTQNSFELMKELFADLRRGTGAIVISSASGAEFAFESSEWKNGVFTYALLEGLKTGKADMDKNKEIVVSELRNYVFDRVKELTNGKQNPTSRRENLEFDFRVW